MAQFVFILKGDPTHWQGDAHTDEKQIMENFKGWVQGLGDHYLDCKRLQSKMIRVSSTDGPFAETKELMSGVFQIEAESLEKAVSLAQSCPMLARGEVILVQPVHTG